ncbi:MAG TPA: hypothetical protein PLR06_08405 [Cyclobacteriaceae bacterium]|nr:hypothetical protein [Cyclobacteriaceae bacterium]
MKPAPINDIRKELARVDEKRLRELCNRLARYKKENTELITYLLFEADDETAYVKNVKDEMEEQFGLLVIEKNLYFLKKTIRKILRTVNKQIRYSGIKETEIELRVHFCSQLKSSGIPFIKSPVLLNLYNMQLKKINAVLGKLPEDLQYDYRQAIDGLSLE